MSKIKYFDSHAHLEDHNITEKFPGGTEGAIAASLEAGVCGIANIGTDVETSRASIALAEKYPFIYATVSIYPSVAQELGAGLNDALSEIESMLSHPRVVCLGEIGLDYHYDGTDKKLQLEAFDAQMALAEKHKMPVSIHDREAHGDTMDMILRYPNVKGVLHSFSGSAEMARQLVRLGWCISFSGTVTYKNAAKVKEAAATVSDEYILVETDTPYLTPVPNRGKINFPGNVAHTVRAIAELRGQSEEHIAALTVENAKRFYRISDSI